MRKNISLAFVILFLFGAVSFVNAQTFSANAISYAYFDFAAQGVCEYTVTEMFPAIKSHYDYAFDSTMYQQSTWGSYYFYINWGY
jgi:hypothetical protein